MESRGVLRNAGLVGLMTMASRVLGLVRDVLMANAFGTGLLASMFYFTYGLPNLFRRLFGEGALSAALVPSVVHRREEAGDAEAWRLGAGVIWVTTLLLGGLVVGLVILAELLLPWAPSEKVRIVLSLSRIVFPYMVFICIAALLMGLLQSIRRFGVPAAVPILLNVTWIIAIPGLAPYFRGDPEGHLHAIGASIVLAGVLQLAVQVPPLYRSGFRFRFDPAWRDPQVRGVVLLALPAAAGAALTQVNTLLDRIIAAFMGDHAIAALFYSERLIYLPLGIIATAMSTVLLPTFSRQVAGGDGEAMKRTLSDALRMQLFIMIPASMGLLVLAEPIIRTLFQSGNFDAVSTWQTAWALRLYAPGLVVFSLAKIFVPVFYGSKDTKTPVRFGAIALLVNLILNITFALTWPEAIRHAGLAAATVCSETLYAILLARTLHRRIPGIAWRPVWIAAGKALAAAVVMGGAVWWTQDYVGSQLASFWGEGKLVWTVALGCSLGVGMAAYFFAAAVLRCRELADITAALMRKKRVAA